MSTITKESIADTIEGLEHLANSGIQSVYIDMAIAGMRRLLASLEAEPVAYADPQAFRNFQAGVARREWMWHNPGEDLIPVYTAPPAPVSVPEKISSTNAPEVFEIAAEAERLGLRGAYASYAVGWNACRDAMLQGAEPVTKECRLPEDFDFDRFNDLVWLEAVASNPHMHSPTTSTIAMVALELNRKLAAGNSPMIPDGLRLALSNAGIAAPESDEMLAATCEKYIQELVTWVKDRKPFMPAAPQQEVR